MKGKQSSHPQRPARADTSVTDGQSKTTFPTADDGKAVVEEWELRATRLLTVNAVAAMYSVHPKTVLAWARMKRIPCPVIQRPKFTRWVESDIIKDILAMKEAARREQET